MGYNAGMAWKQTCAMNERMKLMMAFNEGDLGVSELARDFGVSRKTVYKWLGRYQTEGWAGLAERSRAPHHHPNAVSAEIEREVLALKAQRPLWGAPKLRRKFEQKFGAEDCPAESTISALLRRHGLSRIARRRWRAVPSEQPLGLGQTANDVWCADFKGWFRTQDGQRCTPLTISDGASRYLLACQGLDGSTGAITVKPLFVAAFRQYGLPRALRTDNGAPFATRGVAGLSALAVWWLRLGITLERIEPGCPQQNGRHERMHRTLKAATASPPRANLRRQQQAFDAFRHEYNEERPHEALGQQTPAEFYQPSARDYPERLPAQRGYPDDWQVRKVRPAGQIKWSGRNVGISHALAGQYIGLQEVGDGLWSIHFEHLHLGHYDQRRHRLKLNRKLTSTQPA